VPDDVPRADAASFYNALSGVYDDVTGTASREEGAARFVDRLLRRHQARSGLDVACGTGVFTSALKRAGVNVVGCDISNEMLVVAESRARAVGLDMSWTCAPMQALPHTLSGPFDAVLCMGNSLPHLLEGEDLARALRGFADRQPAGGVVALHLLNYGRVLALRERFVGAERRGDDEYIRFYDFEENVIRFNVLHLAWRDGVADPRFHVTTLLPYTPQDVTDALLAAGYGGIELFGGLDFSVFDASASDTVLITALKG